VWQVTVPNLDGSGSGAYATNLLGTSLSFGGASFSFAAPGPKSAVIKAVVPLPAGKFTALKILGGGSGTNQLNQPFIVTYTDGTTHTFHAESEQLWRQRHRTTPTKPWS